MKQKKAKEVYLREENNLCKEGNLRKENRLRKKSSLCKEADSGINDVPVSVEKQEESIPAMDQDEHNITGKENREHKDSVFVDLFYEDETAKKNLLSLYNALHGTDYRGEALIRRVRIGDVLYKNFKNDVSFEMNGEALIFMEHQSTVNFNMPLRFLMYVGRAYEQLVENRARYKRKQVKISTPEFYTFYNGLEEFPLEAELSLSDAFINPEDGNSVELKVRVININLDKGHEILSKCEVLKEYSQFIDTVRKYSTEEESIKKAIDECIAKGILPEYLKRKGSEVTNMLIAEYNYEEDMEVTREEAREEGLLEGVRRGRQEGRREGMIEGKREGMIEGKQEGMILSGRIFRAIKKNPGYMDVEIAKDVGCEVEEVKNVRKMFVL